MNMNTAFDQIKIGKYIARKRKEKGLTQVQVADAFFVTDRAVSRWENGINLPDKEIIPQLCEMLGITIDELFAGEDKPDSSTPSEKKKKSSKLPLIIGLMCLLTVAVVITLITGKDNKYLSRFSKYSKSTSRHQIEAEIGSAESHFNDLSYINYKNGNVNIYLYFNGNQPSSTLLAIITRNDSNVKDRIILPFLDGTYTYDGDEDIELTFNKGNYTFSGDFKLLDINVPRTGKCNFEIESILNGDNDTTYVVRLKNGNNAVLVSFTSDKTITLSVNHKEYIFRR